MKRLNLPPETRVTLIYIVVGGLWILLADKFILLLKDPAEILAAQTYEGWLYILITSILLHRLIKTSKESQKDLTQNYMEIFEAAGEGIFRSSPDGRFILVNPAMAQIYGYSSPQEMIDLVKDINTQIHLSPDSRKKFADMLKEYGFVNRFETQNIRKDKTIIWTSTNAREVRGKDGGTKYFEGFVTDITKQKIAEEINRISEARYHMLVEHASDGILISDADGNLIEVNKQICTMLNYEKDELLSKNLSGLISKEELALRPLKLPEILAGKNIKIERTLLQKNGGYVSVELHSKALPDGNLITIARDNSARKLLQETLTRSEKRFRSLIENSMDAIALYSAEGRILYQSPASVNILGYPVEELVGKSAFDIVVAEDQEIAQREFLSILDTPGKSLKLEVRCHHKDGNTRWLEVIGTNLLDEPGIEAIVANYRDITERKKTEEKLEHQLAELTILHAVALAESTSASIGELIGSVTEIISSTIRPDNCGVLLLSEDGSLVTPHPSYYGTNAENLLKSTPVNMGVCGTVIQTGSPILINDTSKSDIYLESSEGINSELCVPILVSSKIVGVLNIESRIKNAYTEADERLLVTIAGGLANAMIRLLLFEHEEKLHKQADALREATASLTESLDRAIIYEKILTLSAKLVDYTSASIELINGRYAEIVAQRGLPENFNFVGKSYELEPQKWDMDLWTPVIISNVQDDSRFVKFPETSYIRGWMGIPLIAQEKLIGFLNFDSDKIGFFKKEDAALLQTFGNQAAIAVENSKHFEQESRRARIIEAIADIATETTTSHDSNVVLDKIARRAMELLVANNVAVYLLQDDNQTIKVVVSHGVYSQQLLSHTIRLGEGITGNLIAEGKAEIINITSDDPRRINVPGTPKNDKESETMMSAPLLLHGKCIGSINVWRLVNQGLFSQMELNFLVSIAHQTSIALEASHLLEEAIKNAQETSAIAEVGRNISSTLQLNSVLERIAFHAKNLLNAETSAIYLSEPEKNILVSIAAIGVDSEEIKNDPILVGGGILGSIAQQGFGEIVNNTENDPRVLIIKGTESRPLEHIMGVPIMSKDILTGLLVVWRQGQKLEFRKTELDFLIRLAQQAAIAIENARLFEAEQRRRRDSEILSQATGALTNSLDVNELLETILDWLNKIAPYDSASITLDRGAGFEIATSRGLPSGTDFSKVRFPINEKWMEIANSRQPMCIYDAQLDPRFEKLEGTEYIHGWMGVPMFTQNSLIGFINLDSRTPGAFDDTEQTASVQIFANQAATAIDKTQLFTNLQLSNYELYLAYDTTLEGWGKALELRDKETQGHTQRVTDLTLKLARQMGIPESDLIHVRRGVLMHDIGKMGVPDSILHKQGPLTKAEMVEMRKHTQYAYDLIYPIVYLRPAIDIAFNHHEWWDGNGYPQKIKGEEIPLSARIFAIVDVWDALLSDRPYRKAWSRKKVVQYIKDLSGKQFDPKVVKEFFKLIKSDEAAEKKQEVKRRNKKG